MPKKNNCQNGENQCRHILAAKKKPKAHFKKKTLSKQQKSRH
jgi:hypothetical protein